MLLATFPIIIMLCFSYSLFLQISALYRNRSIEIYLFWHYNSSVDFYSGSVGFSTKGQVCQISPSVISLATSASPDGRPSSGGDRKKWEAGVPLVLSAAQQTLEDTSLMTIGKSFPAESEQAHSFAYNCSLSITLSLCLFLFLFLVCLFVCCFVFVFLSQSKQRAKLYRWLCYRKMLPGRCGEQVQTLRCWRYLRRQNFSHSLSHWRLSPYVRTSLLVLVSLTYSFSPHDDFFFLCVSTWNKFS